MTKGEAFEDVLQQKLEERQPDNPEIRTPPTHRPVPPLPFLVGPPRFHAGATPYRSTASPVRSGPQVWLPAQGSLEGGADTTQTRPPDIGTSQPSTTGPARERRNLTMPQRQALEKFVWLGAGLGADFSASELRSAFRALALRYHPDRHPGISDAERARLARLFADLSAWHRQLVAVVDPARH